MFRVFSKVSLRWYLFPGEGWDATSDVCLIENHSILFKKKTSMVQGKLTYWHSFETYI